MPTSAPPDPPGKTQAVIALATLFYRLDHSVPPLAVAHLTQTFSAAPWASFLLVPINLLIIVLGGYSGSATWTLVIVYFTACHSYLVMLGILGLSKAMPGQCYRFPLVGRKLPRECRRLKPSRGLL